MNAGSISYRLAAITTGLAAFAALIGLVIPDIYRDAPYWVQQARGTDLATLFVAVPGLALGLWAARRRASAGPLTVIAGVLYLVYNYAIYSFSVAMNPLTAVHIAIVGLALWSLILAAFNRDLADDGQAFAQRLPRRTTAALLTGVAGLFGLLWIGQIATTTVTGTLVPDLVRSGLSTNPVYALDLAFFLPLCAVAGVGLFRRNAFGALALPMLVWVPLMSAGVLGGFALAAVAGEVIPISVAAVIGGLSALSSLLAAIAIGRPASSVANIDTGGRTAGPVHV